MNWTISRRIIFGFAVGAALVTIIALIGVWALNQTADDYAGTVSAERDVVLPAVTARGELRNANISQLRVLLDGARNGENQTARDASIQRARASLERLRDNAAAGSMDRWAEALRLLDEWDRIGTDVMRLHAAGDLAGAQQLRTERLQPARARLEDMLNSSVDAAIADADADLVDSQETANNSERAILIGLFLALVVFVITAYLLNRAIAAPLQETSSVLASSAAEILATTTQQASGATESLAAVTETAATVDEVVQTAEQSAERARTVAASAQRAAEIGREGRQAVDDTVSAIEEVQAQVGSIGDTVRTLADQAQAIGEIIATVNDLAEQTNLLALNAAIEAARAGEQGKGFAVVAGEVKTLAEQSKAGTVRVRQILEQIQRATATAVTATERGDHKVTQVTQQVRDTGTTIRQLAEAISTAAQASAQISASAGQQSTGMSQIRQAIGNIQQAAQQNLAATRQAEAAAQELNRLGTQLIVLVEGSRASVRAD